MNQLKLNKDDSVRLCTGRVTFEGPVVDVFLTEQLKLNLTLKSDKMFCRHVLPEDILLVDLPNLLNGTL